jgi:N6-L-threonylcarbamoyladenine synthase
MLGRPGFDFSFSGLKTAVMLAVRAAEAAGTLATDRADIAASFQRAVVDTLIGKTLKAARSERAARIVVAGGVGANSLLRRDLAQRFEGRVYYPRIEFCTDNGAMIALAGALRLGDADRSQAIFATARWPLDQRAEPAAGAAAARRA